MQNNSFIVNCISGENLAQHQPQKAKRLSSAILEFCSHVAGSNEIKAVSIFGDFAEGEKAPVNALLVIQDFPLRLMSYTKTFGEVGAVITAVDSWIFERDVERGFLGEALAFGLVLPYMTLMGKEYLHAQEIKLKKRLTLEILENLVLDFPELSYEIRIHPDFFMYETINSRARLFPIVNYTMSKLMKKKPYIEFMRDGYLEALNNLIKEKILYQAEGYLKISGKFIEHIKKQRKHFANLFKTAQKALFSYLIGIIPQTWSIFAQNKNSLFEFQKLSRMEDPKNYLYVQTASGLASLGSMIDIETFSRKLLSANANTKIEVEELGGILNDVYLIKVSSESGEKLIVVKRFRDWSGFKWFPLTLWTLGTRSFAVLGRYRLERECAINQYLYSKGFAVPKILNVSHSQRLIFMEFVQGETLEKIVKRILDTKTVGEAEKDLCIISKVGEKFAEAHCLNVALGDTKPENILVRDDGEVCFVDFEQASRNGDKVWDIAEFLYYSGHYVSPLSGTCAIELIARAFIDGYLKACGNVEVIRKAGSPKYTKVFSVFTLPHVILAISSVCKKTGC